MKICAQKEQMKLEWAGHPWRHGIKVGMYVLFARIYVNRQVTSRVPPKIGLYLSCVQLLQGVLPRLRNDSIRAQRPSCHVRGPCEYVPLQFLLPVSVLAAQRQLWWESEGWC
jgi:hypothetical protein